MIAIVKNILVVVLAVAVIGIVISSVIQVGRAYEERSLYSYLLKTGDIDPSSAGAREHVKDGKSQGVTVSVQLALASLLLGAALGSVVARRKVRGHKNESA